ncbi:MAG: LemA family protein [Candidatus Rokubacteria bacterium]|nr:LemA family protein [Candidatus Rokubacteria bacterium]
MRTGLIVLAVIAIAVFGVVVWGIGIVNSLVGLDQDVAAQWAQVQNQYQRRADLIPNLVETVKGYAAHERTVLEEVTKARASASSIQLTPEALADPEAMRRFQQAQNALSGALSRLLVTVERYPDLKANQNFIALQTQLEGTENRISNERRRYNEVVRTYNVRVQTFPQRFIAGSAGYRPKAFFEAIPDAATPPRVKF